MASIYALRLLMLGIIWTFNRFVCDQMLKNVKSMSLL